MRSLHAAIVFLALGCGVLGVGVLWTGTGAQFAMAANDSKGPLLSHDVFFTLAEPTPENRAKLLAACHEYLTGHQGTIFFSAGVRNPDLFREGVNDKDFDVALHIVFDSKDSHDVYHTHPRHLEFIEKYRDLWSKVRVFDSDVTTGK